MRQIALLLVASLVAGSSIAEDAHYLEPLCGGIKDFGQFDRANPSTLHSGDDMARRQHLDLRRLLELSIDYSAVSRPLMLSLSEKELLANRNKPEWLQRAKEFNGLVPLESESFFASDGYDRDVSTESEHRVPIYAALEQNEVIDQYLESMKQIDLPGVDFDAEKEDQFRKDLTELRDLLNLYRGSHGSSALRFNPHSELHFFNLQAEEICQKRVSYQMSLLSLALKRQRPLLIGVTKNSRTQESLKGARDVSCSHYVDTARVEHDELHQMSVIGIDLENNELVVETSESGNVADGGDFNTALMYKRVPAKVLCMTESYAGFSWSRADELQKASNPQILPGPVEAKASNGGDVYAEPVRKTRRTYRVQPRHRAPLATRQKR